MARISGLFSELCTTKPHQSKVWYYKRILTRDTRHVILISAGIIPYVSEMCNTKSGYLKVLQEFIRILVYVTIANKLYTAYGGSIKADIEPD